LNLLVRCEQGQSREEAAMERQLRIYLGQTQVRRPLDACHNVLLEVSERTRLRETLASASEAFRSSARRGAFLGASGVFGYIDDRVREDSSEVLSTTYTQQLLGVSTDGTVVLVALGEAPGDLTWGDIWRAIEDDLYPPSVRDEIIITVDEAFGGGWPDGAIDAAHLIFDSIWQEAVASLVTLGVQQLWAKFRADRGPREIRKLAQQWNEQGISRPWLMDFYLGTRKAWDPQTLAKRLGVTPAEAKRVLYMTGWEEELPTGMWVRGTSPEAQLLRGGWEAIINGDPLFPPEP
jgi:hypothetical protein